MCSSKSHSIVHFFQKNNKTNCRSWNITLQFNHKHRCTPLDHNINTCVQPLSLYTPVTCQGWKAELFISDILYYTDLNEILELIHIIMKTWALMYLFEICRSDSMALFFISFLMSTNSELCNNLVIKIMIHCIPSLHCLIIRRQSKIFSK